jgi:DNA-binding CsgD family transcriptional regulator
MEDRKKMEKTAKQKIKGLTPRQTEVCKLVCTGLKNAQIGKHLGISLQTVEVHRYNAYRVLGVNNTAQLVRLCLDAKILGFTLGLLLCASFAWAGEFKQENGKLTITLDTTAVHHSTPKGTKVLDTIHGVLPDGSRFQARVYRPAVKVVPCTTDSDCEERNR